MTTPHIHQYPAHGGGATAETFSPSDIRVIRKAELHRDRRRKRPEPSLRLIGEICAAKAANDFTPPTPAAPAMPLPRAA